MNRDSIAPEELSTSGGSLKVFDIRKSPDNEKIPGSIVADGTELERGTELPFTKTEDVVLYCGSGNSCSRIAKVLRNRGYRTRALEGGYRAWVDAGLPTEPRGPS
jgi:rhodanese-related sulfurtransferase